MDDATKLWANIERLIQEYNGLDLRSSLNYDKFYLYSIIAHSTAIEGSTLTEAEVQLLFDEGLTSKGKPLVEHLMNKDLKNAYEYAVEEAIRKTKFSAQFFQMLNSFVMQSTGGIQNMMGGIFDSSKGDFRRCGVQVAGGKSYMNYQKVDRAIEDLCKELNKRIDQVSTLEQVYNLSFDAHLNLVTIHPWMDGNGRTSRLLMNYIQLYHNIVPSKIFKEDRAFYIDALNSSNDSNDPFGFRYFMAEQVLKTIQEEIKAYQLDQANHQKGFTLLF